MSINYLHKKSNTADKRPTAAQLDVGEISLNYEAGTPGAFFEDSAGNVRKLGPVEVSGTAPNSSPAGQSGNSTGEQWLDTSETPAVLKTWNGSAWVEANGGQAATLDGPVTFTAQAGENLSFGDVVYISGASGDTPVVSKAQANSASTMPAYGFANATVTSGNAVTVITFGSIEGDGSTPLDTSTLTVNDVVYVSAATAGAWTTTKPTGESNLLQNIGRIQRVNSQNGVIKVGGAGRASATPNLNDGNIFVGNASNEAVSDAFTDVLAAQSGITTNASDLTVDRHILPDTNIAYDLGSTTQRFRDIYLSSNSIDLGGTTITVDTESGGLSVGSDPVLTESNPAPQGDFTLPDQSDLRLGEATANGSNYIAFQAPASVTTNTTFTMPDGDGTSGQVIQTNGSGTLSWVSVLSGNGVSDSTTGTTLTLTDTLTSVSTDLAVNTDTIFVDISEERVGLGTTTPTARLDVQGVDQSEVIALHYNNDTTNAAFIDIYKSRGTPASQTAVQAGDGIASIDTFAYNGTSYVDSGRIEWDATDGTGNSKFLISTRVDGTLADRLTIGSDGHLRMSAGSDLIFNAPSTAPSLTANGETTFEATSDLVMRIKHRGSDGITRTGNVALNQGVGTYGIGAHVSFDASAGASFDYTTDIIASGNVSSITRTAEGKFTINFSQAFSSSAYTVVASAGDADHTGVGAGSRTANLTGRTASSVDIVVERADDGVNVDEGYIAVIAIGLVS